MAMKTCKECGKEVSTKAKECPHCGAKLKKKNALPAIIIIVTVIIVIGIVAAGGSSSPQASTTQYVEKSSDLSEDKLAELTTQANGAYDNDDYETAVPLFKEIIDSGSNDGMLLYRYAFSLLQTTGYDTDAYINAYIALSNDVTNAEYTAKAFEKIKANSNKLDYRSAMLRDYNKLDVFVVSGEVTQVFQDIYVFIDTDYSEGWGYSGDKVWLRFAEKPRVLEGDIISIVGYYLNTQKYKTVLKTEVEVPFMDVIGMETVTE